MRMRVGRSILAVLLLALLAVPGFAAKSTKPGVQWKDGERVPPFQAKDLDTFLADWKAEQNYRSLPEREQQRLDEEYSAKVEQTATKSERREQCSKTAISAGEAVELQQGMLQKIIQAQSDMKAVQKLNDEMQKTYAQRIEQKCGPIPADPVDPRSVGNSSADYKMREWLEAYLAVRKEKGAETAARVVLASGDEAKLIESHLEAVQELFVAEDKLRKSH